MTTGVHRTHCCKYHGCKYGWQVALAGEMCPVSSGTIRQDYACEQCDFEKEEYEEIIRRGKTWFDPKED